MIREAAAGDLGRVREIYNDSIARETASLYTEPRTEAQMLQWFGQFGAKNPLVVAEENGRVLGWACLSPWDERLGYRTTAEFTFYVDAAARGRGLGRELLAHLDARAAGLGIRCVVSRIVGDNAASIHLHERAGFARAGTLRQVGRKFDRWLDLTLMQLTFEARVASEP